MRKLQITYKHVATNLCYLSLYFLWVPEQCVRGQSLPSDSFDGSCNLSSIWPWEKLAIPRAFGFGALFYGGLSLQNSQNLPKLRTKSVLSREAINECGSSDETLGGLGFPRMSLFITLSARCMSCHPGWMVVFAVKWSLDVRTTWVRIREWDEMAWRYGDVCVDTGDSREGKKEEWGRDQLASSETIASYGV